MQDSNWKNLRDTLEPGFDEYKTAYEWVYFPEYADGNYDVECRIKYTDDTIEYSSHCALEVAPTGVRCDRLEFDPETIPLSGGGSGSTTAIDYSGVSSTCTTTQIHAGGILARTVCGYT